MIDVKHLTKWFGRVLAVDDISFHVEQGSIVGFLGPNGAGKSTTLKVLTCYLPATSGKATIAGHDVLTESLEVRRNVGYMPEAVPLYEEMRVRELLMFRAALRDIPRPERQAAVDRVADRCWLSKPQDVMRRRVGELSRGYKQRVGLAEAMLHNPPVLVLDEPTIGLDPNQIRAMRELIKELGQDHTIILSSHILAEVEQTCNHIIVIAGGAIVADGTPEELRKKVLGPSQVVAEIKGAEPAELAKAIAAVEGVRNVSKVPVGNWTRLTIECDGRSDRRAEVHRLVSQKGWELRELRHTVGSLEDFFVQVTYEQNMQAAQRMAQ
ncbi:MAG TPA: ATP-binding cassette domain-containing protein [Phycisphaerae bacterium]|nr:ATP-binding cassette domain-containing protein [Phycisphaerae bacterium]